MKVISTTFAVGLLASAITLAVQAAASGPALRDADAATRIARGTQGRALTLPAQAAPATVVSNFLRSRGHGASSLNALRVTSDRPGRDGVRHVRMQQQVGGLDVYGSYVKAAVTRRGELVSVIENLAKVPTTGLAAAGINEAAALRAAQAGLGITDTTARGVAQRNGATTIFARAKGDYEGPRVTRVAVPLADGRLQVGFVVETWRTAGNRLVETLVSGDGRVLERVERTARDSYRVFLVSPDDGDQVIVDRDGWLFDGSHRSIDIAGNNVHAYLDAVNDGDPDAGGTVVTDGNFLATFDPAVQPSTPGNRDVAVQNLFYLNNVIHDRLYIAGFDEAAGNFQEDNGGLGGRGGDSVNAEAQDGGGTDNANFATPGDGRNPRMQMYLWSSPEPDHRVDVPALNASFGARRAEFSPVISPTGITDTVVLASDGTGANATDGCEAITTNVAGSIALVDRGNCDFVVKAQNAVNAGAVALIVVNHLGDDPIVMGGTSPSIPAVMIGQTDGTALKGASGTQVTVRVIDPPLIRRDGDVDSDIVWHEYGHGLTWRMIGRMDGPLAGAIGEGMADTLATIVNDNDRVAEYSTGNPIGLRSEPYTDYPRTYADIAGTGVHFDGEVYGAIGWQLWKNFQSAGWNEDAVLAILVDGMNYTPAHPSYEDMRDGILAPLTNVADRCRVWDAFAKYGVGVGAEGLVRGSRVLITESTAVPAECSQP